MTEEDFHALEQRLAITGQVFRAMNRYCPPPQKTQSLLGNVLRGNPFDYGSEPKHDREIVIKIKISE